MSTSAHYDEFVKKLNIDSSTAEGATILKQLEETKVSLRNRNWPADTLVVGFADDRLYWYIHSYHGLDTVARGSGFGTFTGQRLPERLIGGGTFSLTVTAVPAIPDNSRTPNRQVRLVLSDRQGSQKGIFTGSGSQNGLDNTNPYTGTWF